MTPSGNKANLHHDRQMTTERWEPDRSTPPNPWPTPMLAKALARASGCSFERVQFTPDLLPGDVTGVSIYDPRTTGFEFRRGPVFTQVLLADEINRASPKTQSALLEAMEEDQVTVDGQTHRLPEPFIVLATQNPIELGGTFPLPEAQVDRFLFKVDLGYLPLDDEVSMLDRFQTSSPLDALLAVTNQIGRAHV